MFPFKNQQNSQKQTAFLGDFQHGREKAVKQRLELCFQCPDCILVGLVGSEVRENDLLSVWAKHIINQSESCIPTSIAALIQKDNDMDMDTY